MKILWFITNFNYNQKNPYVGCGWVNSLLDNIKLQNNIEIGVAFFSDEVKKLTIHDDSNYLQFVIPGYVNSFERVIKNISFNDNLFKKREQIIKSVISKFKPDIIHVFGTENPFGLLSVKYNIPVLIHIQGILNPYLCKWFPPGYSLWNIFQNTTFKRIVMFSGYIGEYYHFIKNSKREITIFKNAKYFSGRTEWDRQIVGLLSKSSNYFHCEEMLRPAFYLKEWNKEIDHKQIQILSVVNPNIYKGIETILETAHLLQLHTNHKFKWLVAGINSDNSLVRMFTKKTKVPCNSVNVSFLGPLKVDTLIETMENSDLFVHPSHIDNSPNSVCEAMIMGMPIISTNVGGIKSILTDKKEGLLVQEGEPFGLAAAINELITNPLKYRALGKAARTKALRRHDPLSIVNKQLEIYNIVLKIHDKENFNINHVS